LTRARWWSRRQVELPTQAPRSTPPVLFIHVMKTGGTTVMRNLRETYGLDEIYPYRDLDLQYDAGRLDVTRHQSVPYLLALPEARRRDIRVFTGHFPYVVREMLGMELEAATILRDPVDRTISLLRQFARKQPWDDPAERRPLAERTLEEVYEQPLVFEPLIRDHQTKIFSMTRADEPQTYMDVIEVDRSRLELAKANLAEIEVLGITERYDDFLAEVQARFGWQIVRGARKNATPKDDLRPVDPALRRRIAEDNALDIELYEHAKELVELRHHRRALDV
jgi:hypothetical protein